MRHHFLLPIRFAVIALAVIASGCHSAKHNHDPAPWESTDSPPQPVVTADDVKARYQRNVAMYEKTMTAYERAHGAKCGKVTFSNLSPPLQALGPHVRIHALLGKSASCGEREYRAIIRYSDEKDLIVKNVEIVEAIPK